MTKAEAKRWLKSHYPTTIVADRYGGAYSKGEWLAFPLSLEKIPGDIGDEHTVCRAFWDSYGDPVGRGSAPDDAIDELEWRMREFIKNN